MTVTRLFLITSFVLCFWGAPARAQNIDDTLTTLERTDPLNPAWAVSRFVQLERKPDQSAKIVTSLAGLITEKFFMSAPVINSALDIIDSYVGLRTQNETEKLLQTLGDLQKKWQQQKESEAQFSGTISIWDTASEDEVKAVGTRFEKTICAFKPESSGDKWELLYIPYGQKMNEFNKPLVISCPR